MSYYDDKCKKKHKICCKCYYCYCDCYKKKEHHHDWCREHDYFGNQYYDKYRDDDYHKKCSKKEFCYCCNRYY